METAGEEVGFFSQQNEFVEKGNAVNAPIKAHIVDGAKHGFFNTTPWLEKTTMWADEFIQSLGYLGSEPEVELPSKNEEREREGQQRQN